MDDTVRLSRTADELGARAVRLRNYAKTDKAKAERLVMSATRMEREANWLAESAAKMREVLAYV